MDLEVPGSSQPLCDRDFHVLQGWDIKLISPGDLGPSFTRPLLGTSALSQALTQLSIACSGRGPSTCCVSDITGRKGVDRLQLNMGEHDWKVVKNIVSYFPFIFLAWPESCHTRLRSR